MKIGILTYHRAENYGALLQAYALMTFLRAKGHDVSFVDYWPKYHSDYFRLFPFHNMNHQSFLKRIKNYIKLIVWLIPRFKRKKKLCAFMYKHLQLSHKPLYTKETDRTQHYDIVVYGSDQIWRKQNLGGVGFDKWYFGSDNVWADRKIVYAGSMGTIDTTAEEDKSIKRLMNNFDEITVREKDLQLYFQNLGIPSKQVLDPVFLLSKDEWEKLIKNNITQPSKYILFYNLLNTKESEDFAEALSKDKGLPIKEINKAMSLSHFGKRYFSTSSVEDFLQLINDAEYVVSNSFHGVAMSIILQKQFFAVGMSNRSNRVRSLLDSLGISNRYVEGKNNSIFDENIDYSSLAERINLHISSSKDILPS